jgi:hypothetical protein
MRRPRFRSLAGGAAGIAAGVIGGVMLTSASTAGPTPLAAASPIIDAAHVPPVLTLPGEPIRLRYGLVCTPRDDGLPCDGSGTVYLRAGRAGSFQAYPLQRGVESKDGRYFRDVPSSVAASPDGFSYYAVLRDDATGATVTVPSGGADAPQVSRPLADPVAIDLGTHSFGAPRAPDGLAATARWGSAPEDVGLAGSRDLGFTGPSSFDVEPNGAVDVLDSVNGRIQRWSHGRHEAIAIGRAAVLADLAAEPDGSFDVLDTHNALHRYGADGSERWAQALADRTWAKLDRGAEVLQDPSEQWMPAAANGEPLTRAEQRRAAHAAQHGVIVDRVADSELRLAEVRGDAPLRSWRITSATPLGEVQLAEPVGNGVVVVTHAYTDDRDEFVVLVLGDRGLRERFSVASGSWTETAPLARFRLAQSSLYRLRTTPAGVFVDRFDLEVPQ